MDKHSLAIEAMPMALTITGNTPGAGVDPNFAQVDFVDREKNALDVSLAS